MVNDLLDLTRSDAGGLPLDLEPCDLVGLTRETAAAQGHPEDRIAVIADEEVLVGTWDPWRLEQVLTNLIGNALRFSPPGAPVTIRVGRHDAEAIVAVSDQGEGIESSELERIFERFYRSRRTERAGFGIGLALCRRIAEEHGGRIWAESAGPGHGSTFTMALPLVE
jgi:signal transduction histidine kinase